MAMWKEEKKKRNARGSVLKGQGYEILGIGFVLLLLGFGILNLASPDREFSETENRMLEQRPDVQLSSVADGRFMKSFETWQTDQFVFRDGWIRLRTAADRMLGKKESGGVFLGEDGCLYEKPEKLGEAAWTSLYAIREFAGRHLELPVYLMLVPDAAGVKPEELPPFAPVEDQERQLEEIGAYLGDAVRQIPVYEALREHRDEYLYYRTDHHWTTLGAWYAYQEAAGAMGLEAAAGEGTEPPLYPVSDSFEGTLASVSGYRARAGYDLGILAGFPAGSGGQLCAGAGGIRLPLRLAEAENPGSVRHVLKREPPAGADPDHGGEQPQAPSGKGFLCQLLCALPYVPVPGNRAGGSEVLLWKSGKPAGGGGLHGRTFSVQSEHLPGRRRAPSGAGGAAAGGGQGSRIPYGRVKERFCWRKNFWTIRSQA